MELRDLIQAARQRADDITGEQLWSDAQWTLFAQEAEDQAAERAKLLFDDRTPACTRVPVVAARSDYRLHEKVFEVAFARLTSRGTVLENVDQSEIARCNPRWRERTGPPKFFYYDAGHLRLWPTPVDADVLELHVYRRPLFPMETDSDEPEIAPQYHPHLVAWMLYRAYLTKDAETVDTNLAGIHLGEFEAVFGPRMDADSYRKQRSGRRWATVSKW